MGDRYTFWKDCPNCGEKMECYYAPSSGFVAVRCPECGKMYYIEMDFKLVGKNEKTKKYYEGMIENE